MKNGDLQQRYIELLRNCVCHWNWLSEDQKRKRFNGRDWPKQQQGETMIGVLRLNNVLHCLETVLKEGVSGDLIEAGVWRGGAVILMKGVLEAYGVHDKKVWVADSFQGVPKSNPVLYPADKDTDLSEYSELRVSKQEVMKNFEKYNLLDENVIFLEGWFRESLTKAPIKELALLRLDCDLYESTWQALEALYPKLASGGFCIVDDYGTFDCCAKAVDDYRRTNNINERMVGIDGWGVFWRKDQSA